MSQYFEVHPDNPQIRLLKQAAEVVRQGGLVVYPTDSCYALGVAIGNKNAMERMVRLRKLPPKHHFTLVCRDLSEIAKYAKVDNLNYRLLKTLTPGPYTFILPATREVPRRLQTPKRKTIGLRVPEHIVTQAFLQALNEPLISTSLIMPENSLPMNDMDEIRSVLANQVDLIIDGGFCGIEATTILDLSGPIPTVLREGKGDVDQFMEYQ